MKFDFFNITASGGLYFILMAGIDLSAAFDVVDTNFFVRFNRLFRSNQDYKVIFEDKTI